MNEDARAAARRIVEEVLASRETNPTGGSRRDAASRDPSDGSGAAAAKPAGSARDPEAAATARRIVEEVLARHGGSSEPAATPAPLDKVPTVASAPRSSELAPSADAAASDESAAARARRIVADVLAARGLHDSVAGTVGVSPAALPSEPKDDEIPTPTAGVEPVASSPEPLPSPMPEPGPLPEPIPLPVPEPFPDPVPTPDPVPPTPTPTPDPAPAPDPVPPSPTPTPDPAPVPDPVPMPVPRPTATVDTTAALDSVDLYDPADPGATRDEAMAADGPPPMPAALRDLDPRDLDQEVTQRIELVADEGPGSHGQALMAVVHPEDVLAAPSRPMTPQAGPGSDTVDIADAGLLEPTRSLRVPDLTAAGNQSFVDAGPSAPPEVMLAPPPQPEDRRPTYPAAYDEYAQPAATEAPLPAARPSRRSRDDMAGPPRSGRWLLMTVIGAVALAFLLPLAVGALRDLVSLS